MQRLFTMFPSGAPGIALVLLRLSVALTVLFVGYARRDELAVVLLAALVVLTTGLIIGFLTPILAILAMAVQFTGSSGFDIPNTAFAAISLIDALALALLGPGAYSIDAARFGRRVVELPATDDECP
jgi:hypothetical protein